MKARAISIEGQMPVSVTLSTSYLVSDETGAGTQLSLSLPPGVPAACRHVSEEKGLKPSLSFPHAFRAVMYLS